MLVKYPKYRKHISKNQLRLLRLIFKFRFISTEYLGSHLKKDKSTVYERLLVLETQGYIYKDYDKTFRIRQRPAVYSLTAKGIKYLRNSNITLSEAALRNMYKNKTASLELIDHSLDVFKLYLQIRNQYPDKFDIFTRSELSLFDDFIRPRPDLYLCRISKRTTKPGYQLEIIEAGTMTWILKKRIQAHQDFYEDSETWQDNYPNLLFICGNNNTEKRIQNIAVNSYFDFTVYTTTRERLSANSTKIWLKEYGYNWDDEMTFVGL